MSPKGQTVKVKVLSINEAGKISLSMKKALPEDQQRRPARRPDGPRKDGARRKAAPRREGGHAPRQPRPAPQPGPARPGDFEWQSRRNDSGTFEEMMSRFKQTSDEKMSDLKRGNESPPGLLPAGASRSENLRTEESPFPGSFFAFHPWKGKGATVMREIPAQRVTEAVRQLCIEANRVLPGDLEGVIQERAQREGDETARSILWDLCRNLDAARQMEIPICQDTGMAVVFAQVGQDLHIQGDFEAAVNEGVRRGYVEGLLRCSVVRDPLRRGNTEDNTPAILPHPPGAGGQAHPHRGSQGLWQREHEPLENVHPRREGGGHRGLCSGDSGACRLQPPARRWCWGWASAGTLSWWPIWRKRPCAAASPSVTPDPYYRELEERMLQAGQRDGSGAPRGFGGETTALAVNIETYPTHIAGLPVAVNVGVPCHTAQNPGAVIFSSPWAQFLLRSIALF